MTDLVWKTEKRKINDLLPYDKNPRTLSETQGEHLKKSLEKFNLVEIPAIDTDNRIVAGHQRLKIMQLLGRGEEIIDCRVPNRKLTDEEFDEYNIRSNANTGSWDLEMLNAHFDKEQLLQFGLENAIIDTMFPKNDNFTESEENTNEHTITCPECGFQFEQGKKAQKL